MKVALITRHFIPNYGSLLQTYATCKALEIIGCEYEIINYIRDDETKNNISKSLLVQNEQWNKSKIKKLIFCSYQFISNKILYSRFSKNQAILENVTKRYSTIDELKDDLPIADVYCSGSDQLWGKIGKNEFDEVYYLKFVPSNFKKISYAGSFGSEKLSNNHIKKLNYLFSNYNCISVREKSAHEILTKKNIASEIVVDPTLLLKKEEWESFFKPNKTNKKYILVYQLHNNKDFEKYLKKISKKENLKIVRISTKLNDFVKPGKITYIPEIYKFLNLIYNSQMIITDSFHGTVFSIVFNKKFLSINPGVTKTRIIDLLDMLGLSERFVNDYDNFSYNNKIDWEYTNKKLNDVRIKSLDWLKKSIYKQNEKE